MTAACGNRPLSAWLHVYIAYTFFLRGLSLLLGVSVPANWAEAGWRTAVGWESVDSASFS